jgi:hypothetical protein
MFKKELVCIVVVLFVSVGIMPIAGSLSMEKQISTDGAWSTTEVVSTESTDNSYVSSLWVDGDGTVHVAWHDHSNYGGSSGTSHIFYKYKPADGAWSITEVVSMESTSSSEQPCLMVDNDGTVHVAWMDDSNYGGDSDFLYDIFYKYKPSGGAWSITELVSTESTNYAWWPCLWVGNDCTVHVAWEDWTNYGGSGSDVDIFYKYKPSGGSWSTTEVVSTESTGFSEQASLMVDNEDTVHVAWDDGTNYGGSGSDYDIFYKYKPAGGAWSITEVVSTESTDVSDRPSLKVGVDGTVHVAWEDLTDYGGSGSGDKDIFYQFKPAGGAWSTTEVVSTESTGFTYSPCLWVDDDSTVHVAWDDGSNYGGSGSDDDIFYKYKPTGSSWSITEVVSTESTDISWWASLMVDGAGTVHVSWMDLTNYGGSGIDRDIFYKYKTSPLIADAHGPYYGTEGETVSFTGSATGGAPPYSWHWDFGDGNTSDEQNPEHIYLTPGNFTVTLTVTDDSGNFSSDTTWADISPGNGRPDIPIISGPASGKPKTAYPYEFRTSDPDGDDVFYYIDWGDNTSSGWLGPYYSGQPITVNHTWSKKGTYILKAKAKDDKGAESWDWRTLEVSIPRMRTLLILRLLERFLHKFPILRYLIRL